MFDAAVFSGAPSLHTASGAPTSANIEIGALPAGFDAVVQCDSVLLQSVLTTNLAQAGASTLSARAPYSAAIFPASMQNTVASHLQSSNTASGAESDIELRLILPRLTLVSADYQPPTGSVVVSTPTGTAARMIPGLLDGPLLQISWNVELNLLRRSRPSDAFHLASVRPLSPVRKEARTLLAQGAAVTVTPTLIGTHAERLQLWLEMEASHTTVGFTTDDALLEALLDSVAGQNMVRSALASLASQSSLRASPLFAIRGVVAQTQLHTVGRSAMRVVHAVRTLPNGTQVLTLAVDLGADG